jgi:hypothetical protein
MTTELAPRRPTAIAAAAAFGLTALAALDAQAAFVTLHVNSRADADGAAHCTGANPCTLRAAFRIAEAAPSDFHTVVLDVETSPGAPYVLDAPLVLRRGRVEVLSASGLPARAVIDAQARGHRAFSVVPDAGFSPSLALEGVTVQNGRQLSTGQSGQGGGLLVTGNGTLALRDSIVQDNVSSGNGAGLASAGTASVHVSNTLFRRNRNHNVGTDGCGGGAFGSGGGIHAGGGTRLMVLSSTFDENAACRGGGIHAQSVALTVENSTFSRNRADTKGGGLLLESGEASKTVQLRFNTIADNVAGFTFPSNELAAGAGIFFRSVPSFVVLSGNVLAANRLNGQDGRLFTAIGTPGYDCAIEGQTPPADSFGNFIGTMGSGTTNRTGTVTLGGVATRVSDCVPLRTMSNAGRDGTRLDPRLTFVTSGISASPFQTPFFTSANTIITNDGFRKTSTTSTRHFCLGGDQRAFVRPNASAGMCDIGSIESDGRAF